MSSVFERNLAHLSPSLQNALLSLDEKSKNAFKIVEEYAKNENVFYKNFITEGGAVFDYEEFEERLKEFKEKYPLYPVLYFYGISNAFMIENLLQNPYHCHLLVYERNLALLYTLLSSIDLSVALAQKRLLIFNEVSQMEYIFETQPFLAYSRTYFLELMSDFYAREQKEILALNSFLMEGFKKSILKHGNDPKDALQGIRQYVYNLDSMIKNPSLKELLAKRGAKFKSCVIVSTGPSLSKQLPLLKEVQERVVIFAADSAYPILMQNDIVPDYVCMVERTDFTAEFFKHDFGNKDDKTTFLLASLVHPNAIEYLEKRGRNYILIPKHLNFAQYVDLKAFALLFSAVSVAHMALALALELEFKELVFIGQDLAYDDVGHSHPKDYQHSANFESEAYEKIKVVAYGGEGFVESHEIWIFFRQILEDLVKYVVSAKIYNATQGGARIEGMIEKPFSECCKDFNENKQNLVKLKPLSEDKQKEYALKAYAKVKKAFKECVEFQAMLRAYYEDIEGEFLRLNTLDLEEGLRESFSLVLKVDKFRDEFGAISSVFYELIHAFFAHFCMNLNKILVLNPLTKEDLFNKNVLYIKDHLDFMQSIFGFVKAQEETLKFAITPLENTLKTKGLSKYIERLS
ncbi:TPA: motility associated factor glycosyltransferase family protein [Campylobacter upsaliensis]|uniref:motility associated factor glycosyltransferase family protein n=1 Tax=Campylobacter upsaliensis TaxID=28080 RepID=UPI0012C913B2|nr:motility associated factor glycosyltransferase family protein [Campylobacter upsaliensis]EHC7503834.1 motility associated factor glycosyltransferase family protein [Campylobacter upsaliensis]EIY4745883.1 motility associated factor glycosyltransferase family protein [Campylobacter upsaliensis]EKT0445593.1 motility associated factor glycosyltransferase family protein [Campylobacter upsaliensis]MEB2809177.1 motility associated factor glycosyltransferase family protein [Campylobacter upsaliensis